MSDFAIDVLSILVPVALWFGTTAISVKLAERQQKERTSR